jgi:hypothetical protein
MRFLLTAAIVLCATAAHAQNMFQMNNWMQNQYNGAYRAAQPYYAYPAYRPYRSYGMRPIYSPNLDRQQLIWEEQNQTRELRQMNRTLQFMEWDLQDAAQARRWGD